MNAYSTLVYREKLQKVYINEDIFNHYFEEENWDVNKFNAIEIINLMLSLNEKDLFRKEFIFENEDMIDINNVCIKKPNFDTSDFQILKLLDDYCPIKKDEIIYPSITGNGTKNQFVPCPFDNNDSTTDFYIIDC